jgi:pyruvate/2-oxoglutarate dehydrogenase complex dihydrolipoamide dehydrogenase (E3) component
MLVVGSGPIGSELGQGFARLGVKVTMLERGKQFLPRDDPDGVALLADQMAKDGVKMLFETAPKEFAPV